MHMPTMSSIVKEETIQENNEIDCKNVMVNNTNNNNEILPSNINNTNDESNNNTNNTKKKKKYKGKPKWYNKRQGKGRCSKAQKLAYKKIYPEISIQKKYGEVIDFEDEFHNPNNNHTCILDIGFGMGDSLINIGKLNKDKNVLGCEIHRPGLANACLKVREFNLTNVKLYGGDAYKLLTRHIAEEAKVFAQICIFFPDPWKQDVDRRIVRDETIEIINKHMIVGGDLYIATDIADYVTYIEATMEKFIANNTFKGGRCERVDFRPITKYEQIAMDEGREVVDFHYVKKQEKNK